MLDQSAANLYYLLNYKYGKKIVFNLSCEILSLAALFIQV
jgi:hypothetical protein